MCNCDVTTFELYVKCSFFENLFTKVIENVERNFHCLDVDNVLRT